MIDDNIDIQARTTYTNIDDDALAHKMLSLYNIHVVYLLFGLCDGIFPRKQIPAPASIIFPLQHVPVWSIG